MAGKRNAKVEPIPEEFDSPEAAGEFWDTHDLADYWDLTRPVKGVTFRITRRRYLLAIQPGVARRLREAARTRGMSSEALANQWLREKLKKKSTVKR